MTRKERFTKRNQAVRKEFDEISRKNPKWRLDAIVDEVAAKFFLASRTVEAIIRGEDIYKDA